MRYFSLKQIAAHCKRHPESVRLALKRANITPEKFPGVQGRRLTERVASQFVSKWRPEAGPLPVNSVPSTQQN